MLRLASLRASVRHAFRARGLPQPATAARMALGWGAVTTYALLYQISARAHHRPPWHRLTEAHCTAFSKPWDIPREQPRSDESAEA